MSAAVTLNSPHPAVDVVSGPFLPMPQLPAPFRLLFTTRQAGVSGGAYDSLNLALHVGDDPRRVRENRRLVFKSHGLDSMSAVIAQQVHGAEAAFVDGNDAGRGTFTHADAVEGADALVTRSLRLPLMCFSADCLLMALGDPQAKILAVLHAGWRGLASGVIENTVKTMCERGANAERIHAVGAPAIGACCFEVGAEVAAQIGDAFVESRQGEKAYINLRSAALARLSESGVPQAAFATLCTSCRGDLFFSHRRTTRSGGKQCGRMGMVAWIE